MMLIRESTEEFKVGVFVLLGLAILGVLLFRMDVFRVEPGAPFKVLFNYTYGLEKGAPVQLAGVHVGGVEAVDIRRDEGGKTRVQVTARTRPGVEVDRDAQVRIVSKGLLGQKILEITPGTAGARLEPGEVLLGSDPVVLESIAVTSERVVRKAEQSIDYLNSVIGDEDFRTNLKDNAQDLTVLIGSLKEVTASLKEILGGMERGEGTVGKLLRDDEVYEDIRLLVQDLKKNPWKLLKK